MKQSVDPIRPEDLVVDKTLHGAKEYLTAVERLFYAARRLDEAHAEAAHVAERYAAAVEEYGPVIAAFQTAQANALHGVG